MSRDAERIDDILAAIGRIEEIVAEGRKAFEESHVFQAAVMYNIQIIGEAATRLADDIRASYPNVPWRDVIGMRNLVVHRYFDIDLELVWETITRDLRSLKNALAS